jgi:hypothetical protein
MRDSEFIDGKLDTAFIERFNERRERKEPPQEDMDLAIIAAILADSKKATQAAQMLLQTPSKWRMSGRIKAVGQ